MMALTVMAMTKLVDMPQMMKQIMVLSRPSSTIGFLPNVSEAFPQGTAVRLWKTEKVAPV